MKNPADQKEYNRFSDALDILKKQEEVLDGLYRQTKYERIAQECALEVIAAALGSVPEGVLEKLEAYQNGAGESPGVQMENWQEEQERER